MKKTYIFISLIICFISLISTTKAIENDTKIIVIDPGHGGMDCGAKVGDIFESDLVLEISKKIKIVFEKYGYIVILTRNNKESLCESKFVKKEDMNKRIKIVNESNAAIALSIHLNKFSIPKYRGAQVFYSNANKNNAILAKSIQDSLKNTLNNTDREYLERNNIYLLNRITIPMCIIECGFMSNADELKLLLDEHYQYNIALALLKGVNNYIVRI